MMTDIKPDLGKAIKNHFDAISNRDIEAFKRNLTTSGKMYTIVQNGHAFTTTAELITLHEDWFKDPNWIWEGTVVHKIVGEDVAMALIKYNYIAKLGDEPLSNWLTYVFKLEDGEWHIAHDQSTSLNFFAFAKSAGISAQ